MVLIDHESSSAGNAKNGSKSICAKCGWCFGNPNPSARRRRAHKRVCGGNNTTEADSDKTDVAAELSDIDLHKSALRELLSWEYHPQALLHTCSISGPIPCDKEEYGELDTHDNVAPSKGKSWRRKIEEMVAKLTQIGSSRNRREDDPAEKTRNDKYPKEKMKWGCFSIGRNKKSKRSMQMDAYLYVS